MTLAEAAGVMMLKVKTLPMVNVREAAEKIAKWLGNEDAEAVIFEDICSCLTDTDSQIVRAYIPEDEDSFIEDYDVECEKFFEMVMDSTGLAWGDEFLANLE